MERFFGTMKVELIHRFHFKSGNQLEVEISEHVFGWYNEVRQHSASGYKTPNEIINSQVYLCESVPKTLDHYKERKGRMKNTITILFGAGAETDFKISSGTEFARSILHNQKDEDSENLNTKIKNAIKTHYNKIYESNKIYNSNTIKFYSEPFFNYLSNKSLLETCVRKLSSDEKIKNVFPEYDNKFKGDIEKLWDHIKEGLEIDVNFGSDKNNIQRAKFFNNNELTSTGWDFIHEFPNYMKVLDENFHTLISPNIYGKRLFWRVINYYTSAYIKIVIDILSVYNTFDITESEIEKLLSNPIETHNKIKEIYSNSTDFDSYYKVASEFSENLNVITSNYTSFINEYINEDQTAFLHGKLEWFESAYRLETYSIKDDDFMNNFNNDILFPYIFIQSGIKPIVDVRQLKEYSKAINFLEQSNELIIVGYGLNSDDNHINGLIKNHLKQNKNNKLTIFAFDKEVQDEEASQVEYLESYKAILRIDDYELDNQINIIFINGKNGILKFKKYLKSIA